MTTTKSTPFGRLETKYADLHEEIAWLHGKKNADYGSKDVDPYANFRLAEDIGIDAWRGAVVRMLDKVSRIKTYCKTGELENEAVRDSFLDLANYALIALALLEETQSTADITLDGKPFTFAPYKQGDSTTERPEAGITEQGVLYNQINDRIADCHDAKCVWFGKSVDSAHTHIARRATLYPFDERSGSLQDFPKPFAPYVEGVKEHTPLRCSTWSMNTRCRGDLHHQGFCSF